MTAHPKAIEGKPIPGAPTAPEQHKWWRFVERRLPVITIYLMVVSLVGAILAPHVVVTVPSGHVGLMWKRFRGGTMLDPRQLKDEGLRVLLPWDKMFLYNLRLQTTTDTYNAITRDGVSIEATINVRFRLKHDSVPQLHQAIGPDYVSRLVRPEIGSRMREVIADYTAEEVYSTKRQEIQSRIRGHTQSSLAQRTMERTAEQSEYGEAYRVPMDEMLNLLDTLVLGIVLPPTVVNAINRKVEQYYLSEEYTFRVARERKESERKRIEAEGIAAFQKIVSQGISDSYLRWRGIEATLQLSQSPNSKIVVIGGRDGMPIILGGIDQPAAPPAAPPDHTRSEGQAPAAAPTIALEHKPASHLQPPIEKFSASGADRPADAAQQKPAEQSPAAATTPQSATTTGERSHLIPRSLSDVEALISRIIRSESATTEAKPPETPAPAQPQQQPPQPPPQQRPQR